MNGAGKQSAKLGTFAGVFTPSILTILGIILFLRMGYVVGGAGLGGALLILGLATLVSMLTSVSLAAIATNIEVKGGGDYYLISRTLGVGFGGAIGIVLFLAQAISVAFYGIGFAEAAAPLLGLTAPWAVQAVALAAVAVLLVFAWAGADWATRLQFVIMGALVVALASFFGGAIGQFELDRAVAGFAAPAGGPDFWIVFGIFFPAVTGFTQGVSMSGDLADPSRSLPKGTFAAVGLSTVVYLAVAVLLAGTTPMDQLAGDTGQAMRGRALFGPLVALGVVAATLSSAMASFLGAPRILQALAADRVFPALTPFARGVGPLGNPRRAVVLTFVIAAATIGLGSLNVIAPVVSMFFLISYGLLNYATFFEARAGSPSFRPRFRYFNQWASLLGAVACLAAMLAIDAVSGVLALTVLFAIYQYVARRAAPARWADSTFGHHFQRARASIASLTAKVEHPRDWRPQILAFSGDPARRARLLAFAKWVEGDAGWTAAIRVVQGSGLVARRSLTDEQVALDAQIASLGQVVYGRAVLAADALDAIPVIVQSFGLGRLRANTVLFGWPETDDPERYGAYVAALREIARLGVNVVAMSSDARRWDALTGIAPATRRLDVVWSDDHSGRLAVLAAYLCTRTTDWAGARVRVLAPVRPAAETNLTELLNEARIDAEVVAVASDAAADLLQACRGATMVLVPMRVRAGRMLDAAGRDLAPMIEQLPMVAGVLAGEAVALVAQPDAGVADALIEAEEAVDEARRRLDILTAQRARAEAKAAEIAGLPADTPDLDARLEAAEREVEAIARRTMKASARLSAAERLLAQRTEPT